MDLIIFKRGGFGFGFELFWKGGFGFESLSGFGFGFEPCWICPPLVLDIENTHGANKIRPHFLKFCECLVFLIYFRSI